MIARLAVTGGIAEGKSTVLAHLREAGYETESADEIAREVFAGPEVQAFLGERLGSAAPDLVRTAITSTSEFRRSMNAIAHPLILERLESSPAQVFEVPLLIEACLHFRFDRVWVVTCGPEEQATRLAKRFGDAATARAMLATQLPTAAKIPFADRVVRTNADKESVRRYVFEAVKYDLT